METKKQKSRPIDEITERENKRFAVGVIERMKLEPKDLSCFIYEGIVLDHYKNGVGDFAKETKINRLEKYKLLASVKKTKQKDATKLIIIGKQQNRCFVGKPLVIWCN